MRQRRWRQGVLAASEPGFGLKVQERTESIQMAEVSEEEVKEGQATAAATSAGDDAAFQAEGAGGTSGEMKHAEEEEAPAAQAQGGGGAASPAPTTQEVSGGPATAAVAEGDSAGRETVADPGECDTSMDIEPPAPAEDPSYSLGPLPCDKVAGPPDTAQAQAGEPIASAGSAPAGQQSGEDAGAAAAAAAGTPPSDATAPSSTGRAEEAAGIEVTAATTAAAAGTPSDNTVPSPTGRPEEAGPEATVAAAPAAAGTPSDKTVPSPSGTPEEAGFEAHAASVPDGGGPHQEKADRESVHEAAAAAPNASRAETVAGAEVGAVHAEEAGVPAGDVPPPGCDTAAAAAAAAATAAAAEPKATDPDWSPGGDHPPDGGGTDGSPEGDHRGCPDVAPGGAQTDGAGADSAPAAPAGAAGEPAPPEQGEDDNMETDEPAPPPEAAPEEKPPATHYEALGIAQMATASEVKKAYYAKCRLHHPDKNAQDTKATRRFQFIAEAYQILSSTTKRAQYDATLVMQQACGNLGVQNDPRATLFVQRHSAVAGREVQCMQVESRHVQHLVGKNGYQLQHLKHQSGADLLVLQSNLSANAQVLLAGSSMQIGAARSLILNCIAELTGSQAPRDGVVLIVPQQSLPRMPQVAAQFQAVYLQTGAAARFATADRIVVQGGLRVPQAVVQIQWTLEWRAYILLPTGQTLTPWTYAHYCESTGIAAAPTSRPGEAYQYLLPPADPDGSIARTVICFALGVSEDNETVKDKPLVELATRALQTSTGRPITGALVRAASSVAVHAEHSSLSIGAGAPLLCALQSVFQVAGPNIAQRFANAPLFKTLNALCTSLTDAREGVALRARGFTAVREAVPEDGKWHSWETLASSAGALATFWQDLRTWINDRRQALGVGSPPQEWLGTPAVMSQLLRVCIAPPVECDTVKGIRRPVGSSPPPSRAAAAAAQAPRPAAAAGQPPQEQPSADPAGQPAAASGSIAVPEEAKCEESDSLTPLEITEEVVLNLASAGGDSKAFLSISVISQEAQRRVGTGGAAPERFSKKWYESHKGSFELKRVSEDWRVRLTPPAAARVGARVHEKQSEQQRARELRVAEEVLPKLSAESLPRTLRAPELSALLGVLSRGQHRGAASGDEQNLAPALLRRLCRRGDATPKEVLQDSTPFTPALMMRAIVHIEGTKRQRWDKESLDMVLQAAALDMHAVEERPRAPLSTAAVALWAGAKRPFDDRLNASKCLLVPSAALRLQVELAEGAALQPDGSLFRPFAQMCVWLAHLVVATTLPEDVYGEVLQAFKKLANACEELGKFPENAPCDPEGLCRLAMAIALVARGAEKGGAGRPPAGSGFGVEALAGLARICVNRAMDESYDWKPQQLAVLASAFSSAEVTHQGLFMKISVRAERHVLLGNEWNTEQLVKLLNAAFQLNALPTLSKLLNTLQTDNGFSKYVKEAKDRDLPMFVSVLSLIHDGDVLEELGRVHRDKLQGVNLPGLVAILKELPPADECGRELGHFRSNAIKEAVTRAQRKAPSPSELQILVESAASDPRKSSQRLTELGSSPALLYSLPPIEASLQDLRIGMEGVLVAFVAANVEVPRLEAACAARLLLAAEKAGSSLDVLSLSQAVLAMREGALSGMPAFAAALADRLARARLPRTGSDAIEVRRVIERLVTCALKAAKGPSAAEKRKGSGGDTELDGWVERLERAASDDGRTFEKRLDQLEQQATRRLPAGVRDALGTTWLATLLVRAQKMSWAGGKVVLLEAPRLLRAAKRLAEVGGAHLPASLREEVANLDVEPWEPLPVDTRPPVRATGLGMPVPSPQSASAPRPRAAAAVAAAGAAGVVPRGSMAAAPSRTVAAPTSLVVIGGRDAGMAKTLAGSYTPSNTNHGAAVYSRIDPAEENTVLLYYWDDRDGEEQSGWWFGPEVGGEEVWAHHTGLPGNKLPPVRGWKVLHSGEIDPGLLVQRSDLPRGSLGAAQSQPSPSLGTKRPRVDGARAEELRSWLEGLDDGAGAMLQYYDVLASEFDADLQQIAAAKVEGGASKGILGAVDPSFWETVKVEKTGHKMLFARGISRL